MSCLVAIKRDCKSYSPKDLQEAQVLLEDSHEILLSMVNTYKEALGDKIQSLNVQALEAANVFDHSAWEFKAI